VCNQEEGGGKKKNSEWRLRTARRRAKASHLSKEKTKKKEEDERDTWGKKRGENSKTSDGYGRARDGKKRCRAPMGTQSPWGGGGKVEGLRLRHPKKKKKTRTKYNLNLAREREQTFQDSSLNRWEGREGQLPSNRGHKSCELGIELLSRQSKLRKERRGWRESGKIEDTTQDGGCVNPTLRKDGKVTGKKENEMAEEFKETKDGVCSDSPTQRAGAIRNLNVPAKSDPYLVSGERPSAHARSPGARGGGKQAQLPRRTEIKTNNLRDSAKEKET